MWTYIDDNLYMGRDPHTATAAGKAATEALRREGFIPHPVKTDLTALTERTWLGKVVRSTAGGRDACIRPDDGTALDTIAVALIALAAPLSVKRRQQFTGALTWASIHSRFAFPFLGPLHRWHPLRAAPPQDAVVAAGVLAAVLAAIPWAGEGHVALPLRLPCGRPVVFFDGVASDSWAGAAAFTSAGGVPRAVVEPLPVGTDQQHAELCGAVLALRLAAALRLHPPSSPATRRPLWARSAGCRALRTCRTGRRCCSARCGCSSRRGSGTRSLGYPAV